MKTLLKNNFQFIWSILGLIATIFIWFLPWRFQVNDDQIMMWLVSGAYTGTPESYAVFIHPILSWTFSKLYTLAPNITWYPVTWFFFMLLSYLVWLEVIFNKFKSQYIRYFWAIFLLSFLIHFLVFLQFSIVSSFMIFAGLTARLNVDLKVFKPQASDILICLGMLVRIEVLAVALLALTGLAILSQARVLYLKKLAFPLLLLLVGYIYSSAYTQYENLQDFKELNELRSEVFDHPVLQLNKADFKIDEPELYFFSNGLMDFQVDSLGEENLINWKHTLDSNRDKMLNPKAIWIALTQFLTNERFVISLLLIFLTYAFTSEWRSTLFTFLILFSVMIIGAPFFLIKIQIYVIIFLIIVTWMCLKISDFQQNKLITIVLSTILTIGLFIHLLTFILTQPVKADSFKNHTIPSDPLEVYLIRNSTGQLHLPDHLNTDLRLLGWPTLLLKFRNEPLAKDRLYLVDKEVYEENEGYFKLLRSNPQIEVSIKILEDE